jgi:hypothetical protein
MDEQEALQEFMDHLPPLSHFAGIRDCVREALKQPRGSTLPTFTSIADDVLDADRDFRRTILVRPPRPNPTTVTSSSSTATTPSAALPASATMQSSRQTVHSSSWCPNNGAEHSRHPPTQAHLADTKTLSSEIKQPPDPTINDSPPSDTSPADVAFSVASKTSPINTDYFFDAYDLCDVRHASFLLLTSTPLGEFIDSVGPVAFSAFQQQYNTILDSGCTNHIFHDRSLFWTYDTERAVSVKTTNCGTLRTLARGDVKFRVSCGIQSVVVTL